MKSVKLSKGQNEVLLTLLMFSGVSTLLLLIRMAVSDNARLFFLQWNLFLAWLPLIFAFLAYKKIRYKKDLTWRNGILALLWLVFLPNSFYIISDLIHLQSSGEVGLLYDTALITSYVLNGLLLGFISIYLFERVLKRFLKPRNIFIFIQLALLLSTLCYLLGQIFALEHLGCAI